MATARTILQRDRMKREMKVAAPMLREQGIHCDVRQVSKATLREEADRALAAYTGVVTRCNIIHKKPVVKLVAYRPDKTAGFNPGRRDWKVKPLIWG